MHVGLVAGNKIRTKYSAHCFANLELVSLSPYELSRYLSNIESRGMNLPTRIGTSKFTSGDLMSTRSTFGDFCDGFKQKSKLDIK